MRAKIAEDENINKTKTATQNIFLHASEVFVDFILKETSEKKWS